ncbi:MAG: AzlD domain-containing protein [Burkholderiaceae bacterium]|jgi:branched-subunit amino acid transport protein
MTDLWTMATILGLAVVTLITRGFFVFSSRPWRLPAWAERGLQYAPIAALIAVVVPEVVMAQGQLVSTWMDARIFGAAAGVAAYFWRRDTLLTILAGMVVYLPLHLAAGW